MLGRITLSDFSCIAVSAQIIQTAENLYRIFIDAYNIELTLEKDEHGNFKYAPPFQPCNPHWLKQICTQIGSEVKPEGNKPC